MKTLSVAAALERLYTEGDPKEPKRTAYLQGVVIVGEVPLPVVNKKEIVSFLSLTLILKKIYVFSHKGGF